MRRLFNDTPSTSRRGLFGLVAFAGLTALVQRAWAAAPGWPEAAFQQKSGDDAIKQLYGKSSEKSDNITLDVPEIAENGAVVPVTVSSTLPNVTAISILVPDNPSALAASYKIADGTMPSVGCRLKMAKTSNVTAVVESDGKLYTTAKEVKVTLGGCGG
jgi:sulfur-oxidizing protein SoxY